jgi:hypothetical protein
MEKYLVVANFTCHDACEDDLYSSQWLVGTFFSPEECLVASRKDLIDVACDHYECVVPEEEYYNDEGELNEEEYRKAVEDLAFEYCNDHWEALIGSIEIGLASSNSVELLANDFIDDEYTDQRQIVKYYMYRV